MKRKSQFLKTYLAFVSILVLSFSLFSVVSAAGEGASANGITPSFLTGNPVLADEEKVDPPRDYVWTGKLDGIDYTVHFDVSADGKSLTFNSGDHPGEGPDIVAAVLVKAGDAAFRYDYSPLENADSGLRAPLTNGGQIPVISHYTFVLKAPVATTTTSETTTEATTETTTTESTTESTTTQATTTESTTESTTTQATTTESTTESTTTQATTTESTTESTTTQATTTESTTESTTLATTAATTTSATTTATPTTTAAPTTTTTTAAPPTATVGVFGATFVSSEDPPAPSLLVAAGEMPNTGDDGYIFRIIAFMVLLLAGTLLIFWKYKLQAVTVDQE